MIEKEKQIIKAMKLKAKHKDGITQINGELPTEMYNKIMNSKKTSVKQTREPRTPAWAKQLIADVATIKINQAADHALLIDHIKNHK